jgi:N-acetylmuramoyl-L-alanine amidase
MRWNKNGRQRWALTGISTLLLAFAGPLPAFAQAPAGPADRFVVVLDAAHGGNDAGASIVDNAGKPEPEKAYTLALSVKLRSLLSARGISVVTTRESDVSMDATQRAAIANHAKAQACLSLHTSMNGAGVHLFISSLAPAEGANFVPWKTAQAAWAPRSVALAGVLNSALLHAGLTVSLGRTALTTIDSMTCPAVAVEVAPERGHGENFGDGLDDPAYQAKVADALAAALLEWRAEGAQP